MENDEQPRTRKYGSPRIRETPSISNNEAPVENKINLRSKSQDRLKLVTDEENISKSSGSQKELYRRSRSASGNQQLKHSSSNDLSNNHPQKRLYSGIRVQKETSKSEEAIFDNVAAQRATDYFANETVDRNGEKDGKLSTKPSKLKKKLSPDETMIGHLTFRRKSWMFFVAIMTCWIPERVVKIRIDTPEKRIAWREKVTLCLFMLLFCTFGIIWLQIKSFISCVDGDPLLNIRNPIHINVFNQIGKNQVLINGQIYSVNPTGKLGFLSKYGGFDVSSLFPQIFRTNQSSSEFDFALYYSLQLGNNSDNITYLRSYENAYTDTFGLEFDSAKYTNCIDVFSEITDCYYGDEVWSALRQSLLGSFARNNEELRNATDRKWIIIGDTVYDFTDFAKVITGLKIDENAQTIPPDGPLTIYIDRIFLNPDVAGFIASNFFTDATANFVNLKNYHIVQYTLDTLFLYGYVEPQNRFACWILDVPFYSMSILVLWILYFRLITALLWYVITPRGFRKDSHVICFIPCYTEGPTMAVTIETLAAADYEDNKKLLMIVCDGNITGKGNSKSTPEIALEILGWKGVEPKPRAYLALGKSDAKVNMAKVYSGFYKHKGHSVPYLVIAKIGKPSEASSSKPGNRGKRDSQLILMNFYNKLTYKGRKMFPLEYEIYFHIKNVVKVDPLEYEYCLMVDADTKVDADSLKHLVGPLVENPMIIAACGETEVSNKYASFTSMMQIYEYWINHHYGKCFESFFGKVTCLPGCFSIYRMKYPRGEPFLCSDKIIKDYSINRTMTLHTKNLLHLGEDRYLTTLILKHFPTKRLVFLPMAKCSTDIPDSFKVLTSQRRRWINSTFHNQYVLFHIPRICGRYCCDMKLLVGYELSALLVMPAATGYLYYLIVKGIVVGTFQLI